MTLAIWSPQTARGICGTTVLITLHHGRTNLISIVSSHSTTRKRHTRTRPCTRYITCLFYHPHSSHRSSSIVDQYGLSLFSDYTQPWSIIMRWSFGPGHSCTYQRYNLRQTASFEGLYLRVIDGQEVDATGAPMTSVALYRLSNTSRLVLNKTTEH